MAPHHGAMQWHRQKWEQISQPPRRSAIQVRTPIAKVIWRIMKNGNKHDIPSYLIIPQVLNQKDNKKYPKVLQNTTTTTASRAP